MDWENEVLSRRQKAGRGNLADDSATNAAIEAASIKKLTFKADSLQRVMLIFSIHFKDKALVDDVSKSVRHEYLAKEISADCFLFDLNYICHRLDSVRENLELSVLHYLILFFYLVGVGGIKVRVKG